MLKFTEVYFKNEEIIIDEEKTTTDPKIFILMKGNVEIVSFS